ncbi:hypothetical protein Ancab_031719, partial [Ancistrocladus abbreviatus]
EVHSGGKIFSKLTGMQRDGKNGSQRGSLESNKGHYSVKSAMDLLCSQTDDERMEFSKDSQLYLQVEGGGGSFGYHVYKAIDVLPITAHPMTQFATEVSYVMMSSVAGCKIGLALTTQAGYAPSMKVVAVAH